MPLPATSSTTPGCTPTTSLLRFDGGYEVSMCYRTPDTPDGTEGVAGQAKAGLYASAESGLLWFFSRDNAEVLVKVLNGCAINGYRWVFVAPVTTLEFDLRVTSPTGKRWTHGNTQGVTAATKSDVSAFACADEPEAAPDLMAPPALPRLATPPTLVLGPQIETASDSDTPVFVRRLQGQVRREHGPAGPVAAVAAPVTSASTSPDTSPNDFGCTPTTSLLRFDGGYEVSMCYRTPDTPDGTEGVEGQAKAGLYASAESGLLWFFSRDNAEVLVKVLNGCEINGYRWVFVAPVTTLEFDLRVTSPTGERWTHTNTQGETAATKSDVAAFACADEPEAAPDLIVSDVTVSDATPVAGETITLRATVRNRGDGPAPPATLRFYRSDDSTISASDNSDVSFASEAVGALAVSATESRTLDFRTPSTPDTFYLGACIDSVAAESRTGNNCSTGVRVVVEDEPEEDPDPEEPDPEDPDPEEPDPEEPDPEEPDPEEEPESAPDLTVSSVTVSDANPDPDQGITLRATVRNRGDGPASRTTIRYYQSSDSTISASDVRLGSAAVPALSASATESTTFQFRAPSTPGTLYVGACVDSVSGETDTGNNCSTGVRVVVEDEPEEPEPAPDLTVSGVTVSDASPDPDQSIIVRATVWNRGDGPASATTLRFYLSIDSTINTADAELSSEDVAALAASATESRTLNLGGFPIATFYVGACVDSVSAESDKSNNCSTGTEVVVEEPGPDLEVSSFSVSNANLEAGQSTQLSATTLNSGDSPSTPTTIRFYRSINSTIDTSDSEFAYASVAALAASATDSVTLDQTFSTSGTFYVGACIDSVSAESDKGNNCSVGVQVDVE